MSIDTARGPTWKHVVVRAADEGVPVRAICRIFKLTFEEASEALKDARSAGLLICMPAQDWPAGTRREEREPTTAPVRAGDIEEIVDRMMHRLRLTATEARVVATIMRHGVAARTTLHVATSADGMPENDPKIVDVFVCKARKKLREYGVEIYTIWGRGFGMEPDMVARLCQLVGISNPIPAREAAE